MMERFKRSYERIEVADTTSFRIGALVGALEAFHHAPLTNNQSSAKLLLKHNFLCQVFLTIYFGIVFSDFFVNLLNPKTKIDYLIKRQKRCTTIDYLLNSQKRISVID